MVIMLTMLEGCTPKISHYVLVEESLRTGDVTKADQIVEESEKEYGSKSHVLYRMDRGMTLQLAGRYQESNAVLEQAEEEVDRLYTHRLRTEAKAFLINDTELTYEGDAYEQVMINVLKALNYAVMGAWNDAVVEARRIDHRLNVLSDRVQEKDGYRDDSFARYLSGILYEEIGDLNNAFIAYRNAYEGYRRARPWARISTPPMRVGCPKSTCHHSSWPVFDSECQSETCPSGVVNRSSLPVFAVQVAPGHRWTLDALVGRTVAVSLPTLTLGIVVGLLRLRHSGGGLDAVIALTLAAWVVYGGFLILRFGAGWRGRRAAYLVLAGFALVAVARLGLPLTHFA